jgi:hypothetical protein
MTLGARSLNDPNVFYAVQSTLEVDTAVPTGLRWRKDYIAPRANPGAVAGNWDDATKRFAITTKGYHLQCRHAVWMLHNGGPLPPGSEIMFADGNSRNLQPSNLVAKNLSDAKIAVDSAYQVAQRAAKMAYKRIPHGVMIDIVGGYGFPVYMSFGKRFIRVTTAPTHERALQICMVLAHTWGLFDKQPPQMPAEVLAEYRAMALAFYDPTQDPKLDLTDTQVKKIQKEFHTSLQFAYKELTAVREEMQDGTMEADTDPEPPAPPTTPETPAKPAIEVLPVVRYVPEPGTKRDADKSFLELIGNLGDTDGQEGT